MHMHEKRLIGLQEVSAKTGLRRSAIYDRMQRKAFPLAVKLGSSSRWVLSEVDAWIDTQIALRDQQHAA